MNPLNQERFLRVFWDDKRPVFSALLQSNQIIQPQLTLDFSFLVACNAFGFKDRLDHMLKYLRIFERYKFFFPAPYWSKEKVFTVSQIGSKMASKNNSSSRRAS